MTPEEIEAQKAAEAAASQGESVEDKVIRLEAELSSTRQESASRRVELKRFDGVDVEEYNTLKTGAASAAQKELETSGNFEEAKAAIVSSYDEKLNEANKRAASIENKYKKLAVNDAIVNSASKLNAINPAQLSMLLKDNVRLTDSGDVEVLNAEGKAKFNGEGNLLSIDSYVEDFLKENQYLVKGPNSGGGSKGGDHKATETNLTGTARLTKGLSELMNK